MPPDRIIFRELSLIQKIIADETWLEGERRGGAVSPHDPMVRENVCRVILRIGQQMRELVMREEPELTTALEEGEVPASPLDEHLEHHEAA
jgi:hypothetical protein